MKHLKDWYFKFRFCFNLIDDDIDSISGSSSSSSSSGGSSSNNNDRYFFCLCKPGKQMYVNQKTLGFYSGFKKSAL